MLANLRLTLALRIGGRTLQHFALGAAALMVFSGFAFAQSPRATVVELFTSQGCSSCPPADALLGELAQRPDIIALSEHVDYWDYLGWRDPFASAVFTKRQRDYNRALGVKLLYTPQIVVHGRRQAAGNDRDAVLAIIAQPPVAPEIHVNAQRTENGQIEIRIGDGALSGPNPASVLLAHYHPRHQTEVRRGENSGQHLTNYNVVKSLRTVGTWDGTATTITVEPQTPSEAGAASEAGTASEALAPFDAEECAVLVQAGAGGAILGAARCATGASPPPL